MENLPVRNMEPPEEKEPPRCPSCDTPMTHRPLPFSDDNWICYEIECEDCALNDAERVERLITRLDQVRSELAAVKSKHLDAIQQLAMYETAAEVEQYMSDVEETSADIRMRSALALTLPILDAQINEQYTDLDKLTAARDAVAQALR